MRFVQKLFCLFGMMICAHSHSEFHQSNLKADLGDKLSNSLDFKRNIHG